MKQETHDIIAGAIYDFMAWLSTRDEPITIGSNNDCAPLPPLIEEWAATRGLDTSHADVMKWRENA